MQLKNILPGDKPPLVTVLRLDGAIGASSTRFRSSMLDMKSQAARIERAFKPKRLSAVALVINSPGGSAVQSSLIARRIRALADEKNVPVVAFVEDVAASGGYWLACAADEIFANEASIVGSIGVISAGFGFADLIARYGVERRVYAAGENKAILDPFLPERAEDIARLQEMQAEVHEQFIAYVRARRGASILEEPDDLFSGAFWTGARAARIGLVDGVGDLRTVLREKYGNDVRMLPVGERRSLLRSVLRRGGGIATERSGFDGIADHALTALEERLIWARFGL